MHSTPAGETGSSPLEAAYRSVQVDLDTEATFHVLQDGASAAFWLDSAAVAGGSGRFSIMGTDAGSLAQVARYRLDEGIVRVRTGDGERSVATDILSFLRTQLRAELAAPQLDLPFAGGWVGYLGYECKALTVARGIHRSPHPDAYWIRPQAFIVHDPLLHVAHLVVLKEVGTADDECEALLTSLEDAVTPAGEETGPKLAPSIEVGGRWRLDSSQYEARVQRALTALERGDSYEVCLTDTFEADLDVDGWALYRTLRRTNPAPYAAYFRSNTFGDDLEILSASPERFLSVGRDRVVETRPIKGTARRSIDPAEDERSEARLREDPKARAENLIIVDLLRNDLGQVCEAGSVQVPELLSVESYATVHQLVSTVRGTLGADHDLIDLLGATFPGGSMTGAPKRRTLEIIDDLEAGPRGIYSGTLGYLGFDGAADLSIIIRTIVGDRGQWSIGAGGAIVLDSDPEEENAEKELKASALRRAMQATTTKPIITR